MIYFAIVIILMLLATCWLWRKYSHSEALLLVTSVALAFDWSITIGERMRPTMNDAIFISCVTIWTINIFYLRGKLRIQKSVIFVVGSGVLLFGWCAFAWLAHPGNESLAFGGWRSTRLLVHIVYIVLGSQLAFASTSVQKLVIKFLLIGGVLNSVIGIVQTSSGGQYLHGFWTNGRYLGLLSPLPTRQLFSRTKGIRLEPEQFSNRLERASGTTLHSDWFAPYVVLLACLWLGFALQASDSKKRIRYLLGCFICVCGLVASGNRSGFLALAITMIYVVILRPLSLYVTTRSLLRYSLFALVLTSGFLIVASQQEVSLAQRLSGINRSVERIMSVFDFSENQIVNLNGRVALWTFAWEKVTESPATILLGTGSEPTRSDVWNGADSGLYLPIHNVYLFFFYSHGILALLLFLALFYWIIFATFALSKSPGLLGQTATGIHIGSIALAINGIGIDWVSFASTYTAGVFILLSTFVFCKYAIDRETLAFKASEVAKKALAQTI